MTTNSLSVYKSNDRYRSAKYVNKGEVSFCIAEQTMAGTLITEFTEHGVVMNQVYHKKTPAEKVVKDYLKPIGDVEIQVSEGYEPVYSSFPCKECSSKVVRELDLRDPKTIAAVPVVPLFICTKCNKKYYSISNNYLKNLVNENHDLFDKAEVAEKEKDVEAFINTLNEYIIRIFASKKISKLG